MKIHGVEAVSMYGVCCCEKATLIDQIWIEDKSVRVLSDGRLDTIVSVTCGFCKRPMGATE